MRFDWRRFCQKHRIAFVTSGANTARNHISIRCPFCRDDESEHMGLHLDVYNPVWGCFRNATHRGRHPRRLVQRLLNCSYSQALQVIQTEQAIEGDMEEGLHRLRQLYGSASSVTGRGVGMQVAPDPLPEAVGGAITPGISDLTASRELRSLTTDTGYFRSWFLNYLEQPPKAGRGFLYDAEDVAQTYDLHYAITGNYAWRLMIPLKDIRGVLHGWTGRDIRSNAKLRYRTTHNLNRALLFNEDRVWMRLERGEPIHKLFIVEGPFDAIKLDYYAEVFSCAALAVMGTGVAQEQMSRIPMFVKHPLVGQVTFLFDDPEARLLAIPLRDAIQEVTGKRVGCDALPFEGKDPGDLIKEEVIQLCE